MTRKKEPIWMAMEPAKCSECRKYEISCSLRHENRIWPEASCVRAFMLIPGADFLHLCAQCENYPCLETRPFKALSTSKKTGAVLRDAKKCTACGKCIDACLGKTPHLHPAKKQIVIWDLCNGNPQCVKVCEESGWNALAKVQRYGSAYARARTLDEISREISLLGCIVKKGRS